LKLLLDTCVWGGALAEIQTAGHDAVWVGHWDEDPGDEEILAWALADGRILVTLDKDFGELVFARRLPHGVFSDW
jgi:predicted nuclease of predicted toxin-antitoxin system